MAGAGVAAALAGGSLAWRRLQPHDVQPDWRQVLWQQPMLTPDGQQTTLAAWRGSALLVGQLVLRKNLLRSVMGAQLQLPDAVWARLNVAWIGFFAIMGTLNLWIAYRFDTDTWVNFKLFGGMGLMVVFIIAQAIYMSRYLHDETSPETGNVPSDVPVQQPTKEQP